MPFFVLNIKKKFKNSKWALNLNGSNVNINELLKRKTHWVGKMLCSKNKITSFWLKYKKV